MLFGERVSAETTTRKTKQLNKYKTNQQNGNADIIEYAMPDQASIDRFIKKVYKDAGFDKVEDMENAPYLKFIVNPWPLA
jgi:hypothetical protein